MVLIMIMYTYIVLSKCTYNVIKFFFFLLTIVYMFVKIYLYIFIDIFMRFLQKITFCIYIEISSILSFSYTLHNDTFTCGKNKREGRFNSGVCLESFKRFAL
jgi:hypothetical protein